MLSQLHTAEYSAVEVHGKVQYIQPRTQHRSRADVELPAEIHAHPADHPSRMLAQSLKSQNIK